MTNVIQWKKGSKFTGSAEKAYAELEVIRKRDGGISPVAVVDQAKKKNSALHRHFEWDDSIAAEKYRLRQARHLTASIEVINVKRPEVPTRAYEAITRFKTKANEPPQKIYESIEEIMADPIKRDEVLANAIRDAIAYRRKYYALQELSKVFAAFDDFLTEAKA